MENCLRSLCNPLRAPNQHSIVFSLRGPNSLPLVALSIGPNRRKEILKFRAFLRENFSPPQQCLFLWSLMMVYSEKEVILKLGWEKRKRVRGGHLILWKFGLEKYLCSKSSKSLFPSGLGILNTHNNNNNNKALFVGWVLWLVMLAEEFCWN